ncbi:hypothetical protein BHE74_00032437 [Ensete ventricosum]|nr:hypothetical protein BHE74_00032437 [Ensete ventricosum]
MAAVRLHGLQAKMVAIYKRLSGVERETAADNLCSDELLLAASKADGNGSSLQATCIARDRCWLREIAVSCERSLLVVLCSRRSLLVTREADGNERSLLVVFVQQEITVSRDQGRWQ